VRKDFEYVVVGLGGLGSATAYWLARGFGEAVLGLEQFEIGHARGASQDHSRIGRLSYHTPAYVQLAGESYAAWAAVEKELESRLLVRTGGLDLWPLNAAIPMDDYTSSLSDQNIAFELLDAPEIMARWPAFVLEEGTTGLFQADAAIVPAAKCNAAHIRLARAHGATLLDNSPVESITTRGGEIEVSVGSDVYRCRSLVIAADAWTNELTAPLGTKLPFTITQEQVTYFATPHVDEFAPERFPIWIWMDEPSFYGFPVYGERGTKTGQDVGGEEVTATTRTFDPEPHALERVQSFLRKHIPRSLGPVIYTRTCLYTMPPDRDFVIDALPGHPNIFVAQGAAHAFKFASLIGKIMSELASVGRSGHPIDGFKIDRPALVDPAAPKHFLV